MNPSETNDPLDALLKENDAHIDDAGFTARVMAALPRRRRSWPRTAILLGATAIGLALLLWFLPGTENIFSVDANGALLANQQTLLILTALLAAVASVFWGMFAVVRWED